MDDLLDSVINPSDAPAPSDADAQQKGLASQAPPPPTGEWDAKLDSIIDPDWQHKHLAAAREKLKNTEEPWKMRVARRSVPFLSSIGSTVLDSQYKDARERFDQNKADYNDTQIIAQYEHTQEEEKQRSLGGKIADALLHVPAIVGEGAMLGPTGGATRLGRLGMRAAVTPLMPSLYLPEASQRSVRQGGEIYSPQNLAPAVAMGALQNMVLGSISNAAKGIANPATRFISRVGLGMAEQQGVDVLAGAVDQVLPEAYQTKTGYGLIGHLLRGEGGEALKAATLQAVTFGAFAIMHGRPEEPIKKFQESLDKSAEAGLPAPEAAKAATEAMEPFYKWKGSTYRTPPQPGDFAAQPEAPQKPLVGTLARTPTPTPAKSAEVQPAPAPAKPALLASFSDEDVKGLAKSLGLSTKGKREEIVERMRTSMGEPTLAALEQSNQAKTQPGTEAKPPEPESQVAPEPTKAQPEVADPAKPLEQAKGEPAGLSDEQKANIDAKVKKLGTVAAVDDFYDGDTPVDQYARAKAREPVTMPEFTGTEAEIERQKRQWILDHPGVEQELDPTAAELETLEDVVVSEKFDSEKAMADAKLTDKQKHIFRQRAAGMDFVDIDKERGKSGSEKIYKSILKKLGLPEDYDDQEAINANRARAAKYQAGGQVKGQIEIDKDEKARRDSYQDQLENWQAKLSDRYVKEASSGKLTAERTAELEQLGRLLVKASQDQLTTEEGKALKRAAAKNFRPGTYEPPGTKPEASVPAHDVGKEIAPAEPAAGEGDTREGAIDKPKSKLLELGERLQQEGDAELRQKLGGTLFSGFDPTLLVPLAKSVAGRILVKGYTLAQWTKDALERFGEAIRPHIQDIWDRAQDHVDRSKRVDITALKHEQVDQERMARGLPPRAKVLTKAFPEVMDKVLERVSDDPEAGQKLVDRLIKNPDMALNDEEGALLLHRKVEIDNDYHKASQALKFARQGGDAIDIAEAETKESELRDKVLQIDNVADRAGTVGSRGLNIRKMFLAEDFSVARMVALATGAKKGEIKGPELARIEALADRIKNAQKIYDAAEAALGNKGGKSPEWAAVTTARAALEGAKGDFTQMLANFKQGAKPWYQQAEDLWTKIRRFMILSGPQVFEKIGMAGLLREVITPAKELLGAGIGLIPGVSGAASKAMRERGFNLRAEIAAKTAMFTDGMKDSWKTLTTGRSDLDRAFGDRPSESSSWLDLPGLLHAALKAPIKRAEFTRSFLKRIDNISATGGDATSPAALFNIAGQAYMDANRAIFQQSNLVNDAYKSFLSSLDRSKQPGAVGLRVALRTALPITKVPTNLVGEALENVVGIVTGSTRLGFALKKGVENLKSDEADVIMRQLKNGSIGAAVLALGYMAPKMIGGFYQAGEKQKDRDLKTGSVKIGDTEITSNWMHHPLLEVLQMGATIRRASDKFQKGKRAGEGEGIATGAMGLLGEVPFVRETLDVGKLANPRERGYVFGEFAKSLVVPQLLQWMAKGLDKNQQGETVKRKTDTIPRHIQEGIPGLRNRLPVRGYGFR